MFSNCKHRWSKHSPKATYSICEHCGKYKNSKGQIVNDRPRKNQFQRQTNQYT